MFGAMDMWEQQGTPVLCLELCQERFGLLEVCRVKPLGKPAINRCKQLTGFLSLALLLPQPAQAHGRPQLQRLGLLAAGHVESLLETGFRLGHIWAAGVAAARPP